MKQFATLLFLIIPFLTFSQTQNNYQPGWIVTIQKDTIEGYIDDQKWDKSPTSIYFKEKENSEIKTYSIADISSFKVKFQNIYRSKTVDIDILSRADGSLEKRKEPFFERKKVFLELIANGEKPLYY